MSSLAVGEGTLHRLPGIHVEGRGVGGQIAGGRRAAGVAVRAANAASAHSPGSSGPPRSQSRRPAPHRQWSYPLHPSDSKGAKTAAEAEPIGGVAGGRGRLANHDLAVALIGEGAVVALTRFGVEVNRAGAHVAQGDITCLGVDAADLGHFIARAAGIRLGQGVWPGAGVHTEGLLFAVLQSEAADGTATREGERGRRITGGDGHLLHGDGLIFHIGEGAGPWCRRGPVPPWSSSYRCHW